MKSPTSPAGERSATEDRVGILVVDDEQIFRDLLVRRLTKRGFRVTPAASGEEGLALLAEQVFDVVVMDVKMPGIDGIEALGQIKARWPRVEVIMLTGHASANDGVAGIKAGAFDYLSKPIEIAQLVLKIRQAHERTCWQLAAERERALREQIKQQMVVAERLAALGTLATGVAHEINNPLAVIHSSAGWLQQILARPEMSELPRRPDFEKALHHIDKAVDRARRITQQLLQAVRSQSVELVDPAASQEVDLGELARECIELVTSTASSKQVALAVEIGPGPIHAWTDRAKLMQVLLNLLINAVHATGAGGRVTVVLESTAEEARIFVKDTGSGIREEDLTRIFEPFFTTKDVGQGTGMGLYLSWGIIASLGGLISVKSEVGEGTSFTITLPAKTD